MQLEQRLEQEQEHQVRSGGNEATCAHTHSLVLLLPPHPTPLQVSKLMKKIDRLEKEVTAKQDILEQVSSGKGTPSLFAVC